MRRAWTETETGERSGLRIARAASVCGVTVRVYREMETGERVPEVDVYGRIAELYQMAADLRSVTSAE